MYPFIFLREKRKELQTQNWENLSGLNPSGRTNRSPAPRTPRKGKTRPQVAVPAPPGHARRTAMRARPLRPRMPSSSLGVAVGCVPAALAGERGEAAQDLGIGASQTNHPAAPPRTWLPVRACVVVYSCLALAWEASSNSTVSSSRKKKLNVLTSAGPTNTQEAQYAPKSFLSLRATNPTCKSRRQGAKNSKNQENSRIAEPKHHWTKEPRIQERECLLLCRNPYTVGSSKNEQHAGIHTPPASKIVRPCDHRWNLKQHCISRRRINVPVLAMAPDHGECSYDQRSSGCVQVTRTESKTRWTSLSTSRSAISASSPCPCTLLLCRGLWLD